MKRPRKIQLPATKTGPSGRGHRDSDEVDHGRGYEGDTSSGSGRSWDERSRRPRAGRRSRAGSHGRRSPGASSEANGLALVSGFKRLPRQDVHMRPVKSVLVRRRESEGESAAGARWRPDGADIPLRGAATALAPVPRGLWSAK